MVETVARQKKTPDTNVSGVFTFWRSGRDSNPRAAFDGHTISNRARYDHFDTAAGHKHCLQSSWTATIIIPDF